MTRFYFHLSSTFSAQCHRAHTLKMGKATALSAKPRKQKPLKLQSNNAASCSKREEKVQRICAEYTKLDFNVHDS